MTKLEIKPGHKPLKRKTDSLVQNREIIVTLYPTFMELRQFRRSKAFQLTWSKAYDIAAKLAGDKLREQRQENRKKRKSSVFRKTTGFLDR